MIGYVILTLAICWWIFRGRYRWQDQTATNRQQEFVANCFFIYMLCVFFIVFYPFEFKVPNWNGSKWNVIPFVEIVYQFKREVYGVPVYGLLYLVGNMMLFVPLGFLLPLLHRKFASMIKMGWIGMFASFFIEWMQVTWTNRVFDIDDIIFNSLGAVLGYALYVLSRIIRLLR